MGKTNQSKTVEDQCAALNAAVTRAAQASKKPLKHRVCGCYIEQTSKGFEVTKNNTLIGVADTRDAAQILACKAP